MIVREVERGWQVVLQPDHAELSAQFAAVWGNEGFTPPRPRRPVLTVTERHDDGWAIWERAPGLRADGGRPMPRTFLDVPVLSHLAFFRAAVAVVLEDDAYAGLLLAMHACGIYNGRYGTDPSLRMTFAPAEQQAVDAFLRELEERQRELVAELGVPADQLWTNYRLLQVFDRLSLYFCMKDLEGGEPARLGPVPLGYEGAGETTLEIRPEGPWRVRMGPFPFTGPDAVFTLRRRVLPKSDWATVADFRREFFATPPEEVAIVISPA